MLSAGAGKPNWCVTAGPRAAIRKQTDQVSKWLKRKWVGDGGGKGKEAPWREWGLVWWIARNLLAPRSILGSQLSELWFLWQDFIGLLWRLEDVMKTKHIVQGSAHDADWIVIIRRWCCVENLKALNHRPWKSFALFNCNPLFLRLDSYFSYFGRLWLILGHLWQNESRFNQVSKDVLNPTPFLNIASCTQGL